MTRKPLLVLDSNRLTQSECEGLRSVGFDVPRFRFMSDDAHEVLPAIPGHSHTFNGQSFTCGCVLPEWAQSLVMYAQG